VPAGEVVGCSACHNDAAERLEEIPFPSGAAVAVDGQNGPCMACHQGRASAESVNSAIAGANLAGDDAVSNDLRFVNIHYTAAAATLLGTEVKGAYEYPGRTYRGRNLHVSQLSGCTQCHQAHTGQVVGGACPACHQLGQSAAERARIRTPGPDYDGDGNATEGISAEITTLTGGLYQAIQAYAAKTAGTALAYDASTYPYFYADANGNGMADGGEAAYSPWTPRLLKAAYNYQFAVKDGGAFAHNPEYVLQILYDSLEDTGADVSRLTRP
jgi:hypothetical protein